MFSVCSMFLHVVVQAAFVYSYVFYCFHPSADLPPKKLLTLLLESNSAKDLVCLIIGYYRLFVDPNVSIFTWGEKKQQLHRVSAEEGLKKKYIAIVLPKNGEKVGGSFSIRGFIPSWE